MANQIKEGDLVMLRDEPEARGPVLEVYVADSWSTPYNAVTFRDERTGLPNFVPLNRVERVPEAKRLLAGRVRSWMHEAYIDALREQGNQSIHGVEQGLHTWPMTPLFAVAIAARALGRPLSSPCPYCGAHLTRAQVRAGVRRPPRTTAE